MPNKVIPYDKHLKSFARRLRQESTKAEVLLWLEIKNRKTGVQFHRQVPILNFIVDFYCHELKLAIELDGASHLTPEAMKYDYFRELELRKWDIHILRFEDDQVLHTRDLVLEKIQDVIRLML